MVTLKINPQNYIIVEIGPSNDRNFDTQLLQF